MAVSKEYEALGVNPRMVTGSTYVTGCTHWSPVDPPPSPTFKSAGYSAPSISITGVSVESVQEMSKAVWQILNSDISDELKLSAMSIFKVMAKATETVEVKDCDFHS